MKIEKSTPTQNDFVHFGVFWFKLSQAFHEGQAIWDAIASARSGEENPLILEFSLSLERTHGQLDDTVEIFGRFDFPKVLTALWINGVHAGLWEQAARQIAHYLIKVYFEGLSPKEIHLLSLQEAFNGGVSMDKAQEWSRPLTLAELKEVEAAYASSTFVRISWTESAPRPESLISLKL